MSIENQIALVTGAARGIGLAIALELGRLGAIVAGVDLGQEGVIDNSFAEHGIKGKGFVMDVTDSESIKQTLATIKTELGIPTILVNNAGITRDNLMLRMKPEEWDSVIATNLTSVYKLSQACLRDMLKADCGRIINIASVVGVSGNPGQANYAASKAGVIGFSKSLAREVATRGVTVNIVAPGFIDTAMTKKLPEEHRQKLLAAVPLARLGTPEDIARVVAFLASDDAAYITGETIHVNGGMLMA